MQRWDTFTMHDIGAKLFDKIHRRKFHSHHNHDIHFLARDMAWLSEGIQSLIDGDYEPRCLKRYYFTDEMVDQLHIPDRIFQHILLRILKPTFKFVMNENCFHLDGPTGVKNATQKIRDVLQNSNPKFFIRTDIKSFYKSIPHYRLIQDDASLPQIKAYLNQWLRWWQKTSSTWNYEELSHAYIKSCWDPNAAKIAAYAFQQNYFTELCSGELIALAA